MESGKKPSIFNDRGFIGSAGELDEYGVWVKSEPEDIAFDDSAFFDETGREEGIAGGAERINFSPAPSTFDANETDDTRGSVPPSGDNAFDVGFGTEDRMMDNYAEEQAALTAGLDFDVDEQAADDDVFDVDFGEEESEDQSMESYAEEQEALTAGLDLDADNADEQAADDDVFGVDFGEEESEGQSMDNYTEEQEALTAGLDLDADNADEQAAGDDALVVDFKDEDVEGLNMEGYDEELAALTAGLDLDADSTDEQVSGDDIFGVDFGEDDEEGRNEEEIEDQGMGNYVEEQEALVMGFDFDSDNVEEQTAGDDVFDIDFGADSEEKQITDARVEEQEAPAVDYDAGYDVEIDLDDIPDAPKKVQAVEKTEEIEIIESKGDIGNKEENENVEQGEMRSTELLLRIVEELSTIKSELNSLKEEISTMRDEVSTVSRDDYENIPAESDASERLSGDELDAVVSGMEINFSEPDNVDGGQPDASDTELAENTVNEPSLPAPSVDLDFREDEPSPDSTLKSASDVYAAELEERIVVPSLHSDEGVAKDAPPAATETSPLVENPPISADNDFGGGGETAADSAEAAFEPAPPPPVEAATPPVEVAPPPVEAAPPSPPPPPVEVAPSTPPPTQPVAPPPPVQTAPPPVETAASSQPATPPPPAETAAGPTGQDVTDSAGFKKELQIVLSYMDRLLESLPDEKIEEFARSEQFDIYKKVFKELGLV
ncbi:MAG: hypothetical protein LBH18_05350 [Spirochaetaceae bacterium]|jgi:hypothetical protein|nr:hypothetical protein [Spirochaetaceae bacterium]